MESKAFRLINSSPLTDYLDYSSHRHNVASLSLFYRHFHADCSSELAKCMPPPVPRSRCTRFSTSSHFYSVHLSNAKVNQYLHSFLPYTGKLWNSLPLSVFPPAYDLNSFKRGVQDSSHAKVDFHLLALFLILLKSRIFSNLFLFALGRTPFNVKKKKKTNTDVLHVKQTNRDYCKGEKVRKSEMEAKEYTDKDGEMGTEGGEKKMKGGRKIKESILPPFHHI